jgi:hypothetical protein
MLYLIRHHGKTFAGLTGSGRFNGGVKGKQIGLARDVID